MTRSAKVAANSTSCVAITTAAAALGELARASSASSPFRARSMPRVGSSRSSAPGSSPSPVSRPGDHDRQGQALALAAGEIARIGVDQPLEPEAPQRFRARVAAKLVADPLVDEEIARPLRQQRDARAARRSGRAAARPARPPRAAACSCRRRCGPSARPARRARPGGRRRAGPRSAPRPAPAPPRRHGRQARPGPSPGERPGLRPPRGVPGPSA